MRLDGKLDGAKKFYGLLLVVPSRFIDGVRTFVLVDARSETVTAYGPCPCAAFEAMGRNGEEMTFAECRNRAVLAADEGYYINGGRWSSMNAHRRAAPPDEVSHFFSAETAALASAVAGWPEPAALYRRNEKGDS